LGWALFFVEGLVCGDLLETREMEVAASVEIGDKTTAKIKPHKTVQSGTPRGDFSSRPPVQIHVHEDANTGRMTVQTDAGERELSRNEPERRRCDAAVCEHGGRNTTTIPPRVLREVLARDQHRCQSPGLRESAPKYSVCPGSLGVAPNCGKR